MSDKMELWNKVSKPPASALKKIKGGRISGMTDIKPQWRIKVMTEVYGLCGIGWKFEIKRLWTESGSAEQVLAFAEVELFIKVNDKWSDGIPGNGGNMLVAREKAGLHSSDEAFKMAITDALSTSMKMIGVASEIYEGNWNGSKYKDVPQKTKPNTPQKTDGPTLDDIERHAKINELSEMLVAKGIKNQVVMDHFSLKKFFDITLDQVKEAMVIVDNIR